MVYVLFPVTPWAAVLLISVTVSGNKLRTFKNHFSDNNINHENRASHPIPDDTVGGCPAYKYHHRRVQITIDSIIIAQL